MKITSIEYLDCDEEFYDIQVKQNANYYANNILIHNSRYVISENLLGDVIYRAEVKRLRLRAEVMFTGCKFEMNKRNPHAFTYFVNRIESHAERRNMIVKKALQLAKQEHLVLIPLARVNSIKEYVRVLNEEAERKIARPFYGGIKDRKQLITDARNFKFRVIVGNISLLSTGVNIPRASAIIDRVTPTSNLPKCQQRLSRVLTPLEGKPDPVVVFVLDDSDACRNMMRNEFWGCIKPQFDPLIDSITYRNLKDYLSSKVNSSVPSIQEIFG